MTTSLPRELNSSNLKVKLGRETGVVVPGTKHNFEFIYRLATDTWQGVRVGYCLP